MRHRFRSSAEGHSAPKPQVTPLRTAASTTFQVVALLATGLLVGATVPLVRIASRHGIDAQTWALTTCAIAAVILLFASLLTRSRLGASRAHLAYYAAIGSFSIALPNVLLFYAVSIVGPAVASLAYSLPPLFTLALAALTGLEPPSVRRTFGMVVGCAGTLAAVLPRDVLPNGAGPSALIALLVPLSVAIGNVLRTRLWPNGSSPLPNAAGATTAGVAWLSLFFGVTGTTLSPSSLIAAEPMLLALAQATASAGSMVLFFWLQRTAGLLFTSQVGYIATASGLAAAALFLGEHLSPWLGGAYVLIALGVTIGRGPVHSATADARSVPRPSAAARA